MCCTQKIYVYNAVQCCTVQRRSKKSGYPRQNHNAVSFRPVLSFSPPPVVAAPFQVDLFHAAVAFFPGGEECPLALLPCLIQAFSQLAERVAEDDLTEFWVRVVAVVEGAFDLQWVEIDAFWVFGYGISVRDNEVVVKLKPLQHAVFTARIGDNVHTIGMEFMP